MPPLRLSPQSPSVSLYQSFKRLIDFHAAVLCLIILLPLLVVLAICVKIDSPGPVFFQQIRVSRNLYLFTMFKYRTMFHDKDSINSRSGLISQYESAEESNIRYRRTTFNDPRVTRFGKLLRRSHLDELPQLLNIIKGEMSFVGPRPDVAAQVTEYDQTQWSKRHIVLPGLTGLAQLKTRLTPVQRTNLDLFYVENAAFLLDLKILILTFSKILKMNSI